MDKSSKEDTQVETKKVNEEKISHTDAAENNESTKENEGKENVETKANSKSKKKHLHDCPRFVEITPERDRKIDEFFEKFDKHYEQVPFQVAHLRTLVPPADQPQPSTTQNPVRCFAYGYLVARQWDVDKALEMTYGSMKYRAEYHLDEINNFPAAMSVRGYDQEDMQKRLNLSPPRKAARLDKITLGIDQTFPTGYHFWDRSGSPVAYLMIGHCDVYGLVNKLKQLANVGEKTKEVMWEFIMHMIGVGECIAEYQNKLIAAGEKKFEEQDEGLVRSVTIIVDLKGLGMGHLWKPVLDLFNNCMTSLFTFYPDVVNRILVINSPAMVKFAYSLVKGSLDPGVQVKISFHNAKESFAAMEEVIEKQYIPKQYGGECQCENNCIASYNPAKPKERGDQSAAQHYEEDVTTEHHTLESGKRLVKHYAMINGDEVFYDFATGSGKPISFNTYFVPSEDTSKFNFKDPSSKDLKKHFACKESVAASTSSYMAKEKGIVVFIWDNNSWFKQEKVSVSVYKQDMKVERGPSASQSRRNSISTAGANHETKANVEHQEEEDIKVDIEDDGEENKEAVKEKDAEKDGDVQSEYSDS